MNTQYFSFAPSRLTGVVALFILCLQSAQAQYFDAETGIHQNGFREYDPSMGRYLQSDPIGLEGGVNTYAYAASNPIMYTDPWGLQSLVMVGAPTSGNPFGHVSIGFTGQGVFSFGTDTVLGSNLTDHLTAQARYRSTTAYVLDTTPQQEAMMATYLRSLPLALPDPRKNPIDSYGDTCATRTSNALRSVGIMENIIWGNMVDPLGYTLPPFPVGTQALAAGNATRAISLPIGQPIPPTLRVFNPR